MVENTLPQATEVKKIEDKSLCSYIYVGAPVAGMKKQFGTEPHIQLNDSFQTIVRCSRICGSKRESTSEEKIPQLITCVKADVDAKMGLSQTLNKSFKAKAFKINYATFERVE